ncbi:MAG: transposase, partial [Desulfitobacteriaceae bacterium]|nr:transposase [Desulfitobacteriaceae bacterium]
TSERKLEQELKFNIRYRYFCDLDIYDPIPDHATFSVLRDRLGTEIFYRIFERIVSYAAELGFVRPKHVSIDSTSVIADCARPKRGTPKNEVADPDATWGVQGTRTTHFGYKAHHLVDSHTDFILAVDTTTAAIPDIVSAKAMVPALIKRGIRPDYLAADKAYSDSAFRYELKEKHKILPLIPLRGGYTPEGCFAKQKFSFDGRGRLICPAGEALKLMGSDGKRNLIHYRGTKCPDCGLKGACTEGKYRSVAISAFDPEGKEAAFTRTDTFKELYGLRGSVERVNSNGKRNHGLGRARYRRLPKVSFQVIMTAIAIDLKKMANWFTSGPPEPVKLCS